jgi:hypothetical protein
MTWWGRRAARFERALTPFELDMFEPHFDAEVLHQARLIDGHVPLWLRPDMNGVTLKTRIYLRPGAYQANCADSIELLAHELVHVQQYLGGMTLWRYLWACRRGYWRNPYELAAYAQAARIRAQLFGTASTI